MDLTNRQAKKIYEQFREIKTIYGIKNSDLEINFIKLGLWVFPLAIFLGMIFNFRNYYILTETQKTIFHIVAIITAILSVLGFLNSFYKLYFYNNNLVIENKFKKQIIIDINTHPRVYIRKRTFDSLNQFDMLEEINNYELHIKQDEIDFVLDIRIAGSDKIRKFLNSVEIK